MQVRRLAVRELRVPPPVSTTPLASDLPLLRHDADPFGVNNHPTWMSLPRLPGGPKLREAPEGQSTQDRHVELAGCH